MNLIELADHYCRHEFDVLGSGWVRTYYGMAARGFEQKNFSGPWSREEAYREIPEFYLPTAEKFLSELPPGYEPIDWQIDLRSGYRFSAGIHHSKLQYGVVEGVDAKVSADLGRLYQLPILARAFKQSGDVKYRDEALAQLRDFLAFNAPEYGAAWRANMNVSIRAASIVAAFELLDEEPDAEIRKSIYAHGDFIINNLEYPEDHYHPNHYIANLAGLLMAAAFLGHQEWRDFAVKTLDEQILWQSNPEGTNFEGATSYHFFVLEMISAPLLYAARKENKIARNWLEENLSPEAVDRLYRIFVAAKALTLPDGNIPLIGDNDSGRFMYIEDVIASKCDFRFLNIIGASLFADPSLLLPNIPSGHKAYAEFLLGALIEAPAEPPADTAYPEAGFYIMHHDDSAIFINCGPIGTNGKGGHAHNDKLALTLQINKLDIFVDPGIYAYTASRYFRDLFRSTAVHNTLQVKNYEQNARPEKSIWWGMEDNTRCEMLEWSPGHFRGRHHGFERYSDGMTHERTIDWNKEASEIVIIDKLASPAEAVSCGFTIHDEVVVTGFSAKELKLRRGNVSMTITAGHGNWRTEPAYFSPSYGIRIPTQRLILDWQSGNAENSITVKFQKA